MIQDVRQSVGEWGIAEEFTDRRKLERTKLNNQDFRLVTRDRIPLKL